MPHCKNTGKGKFQQTRIGWCEPIRVNSLSFLVNSHHQACRYETSDGKPLSIGYYLVLWPSGSSRSNYGRELRYLGPFAMNTTTQLLQISAFALGIVAVVMGCDKVSLFSQQQQIQGGDSRCISA